jgi:hypothetical protein
MKSLEKAISEEFGIPTSQINAHKKYFEAFGLSLSGKDRAKFPSFDDLAKATYKHLVSDGYELISSQPGNIGLGQEREYLFDKGEKSYDVYIFRGGEGEIIDGHRAFILLGKD